MLILAKPVGFRTQARSQKELEADANALRCGESAEIWVLPTAAVSDSIEALGEILNPGERARAASFRRHCDRNAFIAAHALARVMLSRFGTLAPAEWVIGGSRFGQPSLFSDPAGLDFRFSLSHTDDMVACGLVCRHEIGIDLECDSSAQLLKLARDMWLTTEERTSLSALEGSAWIDRALRLWTLKEACAKAMGLGLHFQFNQIGFDPVRLSLSSGPIGAWQFEEFRPTSRHHLAVSVLLSGRSDLIVRFRQIQADAFHPSG